jgi:hypothetical protein
MFLLKKNLMFCFLLVSAQLLSQSFQLRLASEVEQWSEPIVCNMGNKGNLTVRVKLIKHFGTTCVFDVEFTNNSNTVFKGAAGLKRENDSVIYGANLVNLKLNPSETATYLKLEKRECKMSMSKKRDQVKLCMECEPWIGFVVQ